MTFSFMTWAFVFNVLTFILLVFVGVLLGRIVMKIQKNASDDLGFFDYVKIVKSEIFGLFTFIAVLFLFSGASGVKREINVPRPTVIQQETRDIVTPEPRTETLDGFRPLR